MPINYWIDENRGVVLMRGWGRLVNEEMVDCITRLRADERDGKPAAGGEAFRVHE